MYSLGRVTAVSGSQMTVEADEPLANSIRIGAMVKTRSVDHEVVGTIASVEVEGGPPSRSIFVVDLLGEIVASTEGQGEFRRGVSHYPISGAPVRDATDDDIRAVYTRPRSPMSASARSFMIRPGRHLYSWMNCWRRISPYWAQRVPENPAPSR